MPENQETKITDEKFTGIFALGLTDNIYLNMLVIYSIGMFGLIIKLFFAPSKDMYGNIGPANTNIGGYTLLLVSFIIIFCSFFGVSNTIGKLRDLNKLTEDNKKVGFKDIFNRFLENREFAKLLIPIIIVCILIVYVIFINFTYFEKINKVGGAPPIYYTYEFVASLLFITTTIVIYKYSWEYFFRKDRHQSMIKWAAILLSTFNIFILIIIHIILEFYTLGSNEYITQNI